MSKDALEGLQREIKMYDGRVFGHKVSNYGLDRGYLDYDTLGRIVGARVLNNNIMGFAGYDDWDLINGEEEECDIYQYYIITEAGYWILENFTDEYVYYHEELDMYIWAIRHFGTSWDYVLTDIKLVEGWDL